MIDVFTIGFTKSSAKHFFERLIKAGVRKVIDVRLHNSSQLAGFAKATDLDYLLHKAANIDFAHEQALAPTDDILSAYKKKRGSWDLYEQQFLELMAERQIEKKYVPHSFDRVCLLCSEDKPHHCHRRLVCDYLNDKWDGALSVHHL